METIVREITWLRGVDHGWGNGYVLIPEGHPMHGKDYDDIDVSVHGGLTFSESGSGCKDILELPEGSDSCWVVGFDTAHGGDNSYNWTKSRVIEETNNLAKQLEELSIESPTL